MKDLISVLLEDNLVTRDQIKDARDKQAGAKRPLQELLIEMGFVSEDLLMITASKAFDAPVIAPDEIKDPAVIRFIPFDLARQLGVFPLRQENATLVLAMSNPVDLIAIDTVSSLSHLGVKPVLATKSQIIEMINEGYEINDALYDILKNSNSDASIKVLKDFTSDTRTVDLTAKKEDDSSLIKLVNLILGDAVKMRASDIHVEPQENNVVVRYRIDGYLKNIMTVPVDLQPRFASRIKIIAGLDVAERRKPQDGRIKISVNNRRIDLRINIIPTFYGEKIAIRLLDQQEARTTLDKIGFGEKELQLFSRILVKPQGMILVTGPTGSGKTSTLYAALNFVKNETKHIITIEDPIEYLIDGINQIQLNPAKDLTFATSLRSILRQDPNIIFIGEIRDKETAEIAFQAAQTGHLVFSTLHTLNSIASISRLYDIGLEPFLVSSSLMMVVAQRLVRLICPHCKEAYQPSAEELERLNQLTGSARPGNLYRAKGCQKCNFSGFLGRSAVFEIMEVNQNIRECINKRAPESEILKEAKNNGLQTLAQSAVRKVLEGLTTIEEISRVIDIAKEETVAEKQVSVRKNAKILIVDDEDDLLRTLELRLQGFGYEVVKARDGLEAIEQANKERPDLIIMDVNMPKMDGFEATKILRTKLVTASIPIILLTARQDKESELTGLDAGADDYIVKPYDKDKLLARLRMLLRKK